MLVIDRRKGESLVLVLPDGRRVRVEYRCWKRGSGARLAVEADRDVPVWRAELVARGAGPAAQGGLRVRLPRGGEVRSTQGG